VCGIVGISFRENVSNRIHLHKDIRAMFSDMLVRAQERGSGATGVVLASKNKVIGRPPKINVFRAPLSAKEFVKTKEFNDILGMIDENTLSIIGHTRAVTDGTAHNNKNNHPHIAGSIIGVHNGVINNDVALWNKYAEYMLPQGDCDSEIFFALVNRKKVSKGTLATEKAMGEALREIAGWYTFALVDAKDPGKVFLVKDQQGDLDIAWWSYGEAAIFASKFEYIEKSFCTSMKSTAGKLTRYRIDPYTIIIMDSTVKGETKELLVRMEHVAGLEVDINKIIRENKTAYEITQGYKSHNG
jgi:glutamine phosphoribosylpyrophosphate amidotransferase